MSSFAVVDLGLFSSIVNPNNSEIGQGNSVEEMKVIDNLSFDRRGDIQGNC